MERQTITWLDGGDRWTWRDTWQATRLLLAIYVAQRIIRWFLLGL